MRSTSLMILLSFLAAGQPAASQDAPAVPPAVERWSTVLESPDITPEDLESARVALRSLAAGLRDDPTTREANFALARYWATRSEEGESEATRAMAAATSLYPQDPRTPGLLEQLIDAQLEAGDTYGAHLTFRQRIGPDPADVDPRILARGADCAARVGDHGIALAWARTADPDSLERAQRTSIHVARLISGEALGRFDLALGSAEWLATEAGETLHVTPEALVAAGRTFEATGLLEEAISHYTTFVNVFAASQDQPEALLALGRLLARTGQPARARRFLDWLVEKDGASPQAVLGRLQLMELDEAPAKIGQTAQYLDVIRNAPDMASARAACDRFVLRFLSAGHALELLTALRSVVVDPETDPNALYPLVAKDAALRALDPILALLEARDDTVALAAASVEISTMSIPIPAHHRPAVALARSRVGLSPLPEGPVELAIVEARAAMANENWSAAVDTLNLALISDRAPLARTEIEARELMGEALWRDGRPDEALKLIGAALERFQATGMVRPLLVVRADILFSRGDRDASCADYGRAAEAGFSRWVDLQLERCRAAAATAEIEKDKQEDPS